MQQKLFTIGHSNHETAQFLSLLAEHNITAVADVRSTPYSRFNPQFNREVLQQSLIAKDITYLFFGEEFGAQRTEPECYIEDQAMYELIARTNVFNRGIKRLLDEMQYNRIALMCAEKDPITCHRTILVCKTLKSSNLRISHILEDGSIETNEDAETRLLQLVGLSDQSLFQSRKELIDDAYHRQGKRIAYKIPADKENETITT